MVWQKGSNNENDINTYLEKGIEPQISLREARLLCAQILKKQGHVTFKLFLGQNPFLVNWRIRSYSLASAICY